MQWAKTSHGSGGFDTYSGVAMAGGGSIIAVGDSGIASNTDWPNALITKYSPDGTLVWAKTFGGTGDDGFRTVALSGDGGIVAAGYNGSTDGDFPPSSGDWDTLVAIISQDGMLRL